MKSLLNPFYFVSFVGMLENLNDNVQQLHVAFECKHSISVTLTFYLRYLSHVLRYLFKINAYEFKSVFRPSIFKEICNLMMGLFNFIYHQYMYKYFNSLKLMDGCADGIVLFLINETCVSILFSLEHSNTPLTAEVLIRPSVHPFDKMRILRVKMWSW